MNKQHVLQKRIIFGLLFLGGVSLSYASTEKDFGLSTPMSIAQQTLIVQGMVTDTNGEPIIGASVVEEGTTNGVITNVDGNFSIQVSIGKNLVISYIGYETQTVKVTKSGQQMKVVLKESAELIDEVVVVGYGVQKKATLSGAVASVKGGDIVKSPAMNITNSIGGTIPGLTVVGQSGEPGADGALLYIRGKGSLNDCSPLIVVDGVPNRSLERLDPSTIENITVLKDASAAIYGSQAANGVILVTTKRGRVEKFGVSANYTLGISQPTHITKVTNAAEWATMANEVCKYKNEELRYTPEEIRKYADGSDPWRYPSTDWFGETLKDWTLQHNANLTLSGGTEKLQSFISLSSRFQDGVFKNSASKYAQHDLRINVDGKVNDYIKVSVDASMRMEEADSPTRGTAEIFRDLMTATPNKPAYWPNGLPGPVIDEQNQSTPIVDATPVSGYVTGENYILNLNAKVQIDIPWVKGLSLTGTAAFDRGLYYSKKFSRKYELYAWDGVSEGADGLPLLVKGEYGKSRSLTQRLDIQKEHLLNALINYQRTFNEDHNVNVLAGAECIEENSNWFSAERRNFTAEYPDELNFGDANQQFANGSTPGMNRWLNYFGRLNYAYQGKYIAEFVWRYQGSSKFAPKTRWGFFPGVSVAYRISEENFWKKSKASEVINDLKLRGSWGKTGNDLIDPYQFYSLYKKHDFDFVTGDPLTNTPAYREFLAANIGAQWEEANQLNIGFDMSLLNNRLLITADYFNNLRTKILIPQSESVPDWTGLTGVLPDVNLGKVRNRGFDFQVAWNDRIGNDFIYRVSLNGGHAKNKIEFFDEAEGGLPWQVQTGHPMHSDLYYEVLGVFQTEEDLKKYPHMEGARPGDLIFKDVNDDKEINGEDRVRIHKSDVPTWTGGLNLYFKYKNFDFSALFQGQLGAVRYMQPKGNRDKQNYLKSYYDNRWTEENPYTNYPRTYNGNEEYWVSAENRNTFWLEKTDFLRLKNLEIGYTVPTQIAKKVGLQDLRFTVGGMNLLTFTPMKDYDPELVSQSDGYAGQGYPQSRIITVGFSLKF